MENSIVFIVISNNNPTSLIITSQSKSSSDVVVKCIIQLATVCIIHVQKIVKKSK